jgi:hypothetical protein
MKNRKNLIIGAVILALVAGAVLFFLLRRPDLSGSIVIPYIAHQRPAIDPHLPGPTPLSDKLDEVQFDGLFNLSANPSGIVYEDGLGELIGIDADNVVSVRLKEGRRWHDSYQVTQKDDNITIAHVRDHYFAAADFRFTIKRIMAVGSLSPDYILLTQAMEDPGFDGPDSAGVIRFHFRQNRIWKDADIKEVLSVKIIPDGSPMNALNYAVGTAPYLALPPKDGVSNYLKSPDGVATIPRVDLSPFVDNSTYATELRNGAINVLLETPFGAVSPLLVDREKYFMKSNVSTTFFAVVFNTRRLGLDQRRELRKLLDSRAIAERFFKVNTPQQRHIQDYKGNRDNYSEYLNHGLFPSSSYYVEEKILDSMGVDATPANLTVLPDTVRIRACPNFGFREEYGELIDILNDPAITRGRVRAVAVGNEEIQRGDYDALLLAFSGYRSNFLFDLYDIFLRQPDLAAYRVNLETGQDDKGVLAAKASSLRENGNFFRLDATNGPDAREAGVFLQYLYGFMSTRNIGDKQEYARRIDQMERSMNLGAWLFSLPSLAYFSTQFDSTSVDLYGVASQLSTIKKWRENRNR